MQPPMILQLDSSSHLALAIDSTYVDSQVTNVSLFHAKAQLLLAHVPQVLNRSKIGIHEPVNAVGKTGLLVLVELA